MEGLLPVRGQIFFLLPLPNFLSIFFLDRNKHIGIVLCPLPPHCVPSPVPAGPLSLPSESSRVCLLPGPQPDAGSSALDASAHPPAETESVWRGGQGLRRTGRRGRGGGKGGEEDSSLRAEPDEHSEGSRRPIPSYVFFQNPWPWHSLSLHLSTLNPNPYSAHA